MDRRFKAFAVAALLPLLAACTESPETVFNWDVNDTLPKPHAQQAANGAQTYVYRGESTSVAAPKSRSAVTAINMAPLSSGSVAFAWPVEGPVISPFGATSGGARNDGINIAAARGTPIHAAAGGTVTYAGDELKDYGNLVLIKHADGYVTAYAHADSLIVGKGDVVTKGQVIGYAGKTGDVSSPQLHFEIRHDTTPVNPSSLLNARNS
jgi:murein DD-endopeptidase MepM/ murein hydrolase activator NlpD